MVGANGQVWSIAFNVNNFRGPGVYHSADVSFAVRSLDGTQKWLNQPADKITFTLDPTQQSGTVDASLSEVVSGKSALHITGQWNCQG
jgi:hypothetical protein